MAQLVIADDTTGYIKRKLYYFNESKTFKYLGKSVYLTSDSKAEIKKVLKFDQDWADKWATGRYNFVVMTLEKSLQLESQQPKEIEEERPCPDDDDYECYSCGEPTGRGYDSGQCCQCLGE